MSEISESAPERGEADRRQLEKVDRGFLSRAKLVLKAEIPEDEQARTTTKVEREGGAEEEHEARGKGRRRT